MGRPPLVEHPTDSSTRMDWTAIPLGSAELSKSHAGCFAFKYPATGMAVEVDGLKTSAPTYQCWHLGGGTLSILCIFG